MGLASAVLVAAKGPLFTNSFLVRLKKAGGPQLARQVADRTGFDFLGPVST